MAVEEQTEHDMNLEIRTGYITRHSQRMIIPNRQVTKLSFVLHKKGTGGTGDITFALRKVSDDSIIASKVWGDSGDLTGDDAWYEVELDTPVTVNEEIRQSVEYTGADPDNCPVTRAKNSDVKADEYLSWYSGSWVDQTGRDLAYRYTYTEEAGETAYDTKVGSPTSWGWEKCDYGGAEQCPVGSQLGSNWQAPIAEGPSKTPQGGPPSFIWGSE